MYHPFVSIVIPVYNGGNYMGEAIESALAQTYDRIEVIVVNDGSDDNGETERIALGYGDRIRYFYKENGGCSDALNYGISKMEGEWFSWLSHDDVYEPDKIEKSITCVTDHGLEAGTCVVSAGASYMDASGKPVCHPRKEKKGFYPSEAAFRTILLESCPHGCGLLIPGKILKEIGPFRKEHRYLLDWEYWLEIALHGYDYFFMGEKLVKGRVHNNQVTVRQNRLLQKETDEHAGELAERLLHGAYEAGYIKCMYRYLYKKGYRVECRKLRQHMLDRGIYHVADTAGAIRWNVKYHLEKPLKALYHKMVRH